MGDMLSQAEINALLGGDDKSLPQQADADIDAAGDLPDLSGYVIPERDFDGMLDGMSRDILGEIGNISMGTAATTLFALLRQKVWITTPRVSITDWKTLSDSYDRPCVGIRVDYKEGLQGSNILILKERDVKIIADLMMSGDGEIDDDKPLTDLDLSAIGEAMNQMVGSSSTSLSSMIKQKIDIATPQPFLLDFADNQVFDTIGFKPDDCIVKVAFKMEIGSLIDSEIMQILPLEFGKEMVAKLKSDMGGDEPPPVGPPEIKTAGPPPDVGTQTLEPAPQASPQLTQQETQMIQQAAQTANMQPDQTQQPQGYGYQAPPQAGYGYQQQHQPYAQPQRFEQQVNVQPAQFQSFDEGSVLQQKENIGIIMDVPLDITVELGRTRKKIHEILEFSPGTIIDLDKLAGEPIDILVNGKFVAKGEVVVIDENFGIRITDIISVDKRI